MIGSFFRVLFFTLLALVLCWGACLSDASFLERTTASDFGPETFAPADPEERRSTVYEPGFRAFRGT